MSKANGFRNLIKSYLIRRYFRLGSNAGTQTKSTFKNIHDPIFVPLLWSFLSAVKWKVAHDFFEWN